MNPISKTVPQRSWWGRQALDLELVSFLHCWMDTQGLSYSINRESFKIVQRICFLESPGYAGRWGKLDQEHLNAAYSIVIEAREGKKKNQTQKNKPKQLNSNCWAVSVHQSIWFGKPPFPGCIGQEECSVRETITDAYSVKEVILIYSQIQNSYFGARVMRSYKIERIRPEQVH